MKEAKKSRNKLKWAKGSCKKQNKVEISNIRSLKEHKTAEVSRYVSSWTSTNKKYITVAERDWSTKNKLKLAQTKLKGIEAEEWN